MGVPAVACAQKPRRAKICRRIPGAPFTPWCYGGIFRETLITTPSRSDALNRDTLRDGLPHAVQCLKSHRASLIGDDCIDDYVALDWLEWRGGHLQLTVVGQNICRQITLSSAPVNDA